MTYQSKDRNLENKNTGYLCIKFDVDGKFSRVKGSFSRKFLREVSMIHSMQTSYDFIVFGVTIK